MKKVVFNSHIVSVSEEKIGLKRKKRIITLESPDWVNIIPITKNNQVVLVKQFRFGTKSETLEIPGGMIDNHETPSIAAGRELFEETGYSYENITKLGNISPNPALFNNRVFTFLANDAYLSEENINNQDEINEVVLVDLSDVPKLLKTGAIEHALVIAAFHLMNLNK
jgi:8-oxo-dGTP pyrophosphatase MutT (NUDIX family)